MGVAPCPCQRDHLPDTPKRGHETLNLVGKVQYLHPVPTAWPGPREALDVSAQAVVNVPNLGMWFESTTSSGVYFGMPTQVCFVVFDLNADEILAVDLVPQEGARFYQMGWGRGESLNWCLFELPAQLDELKLNDGGAYHAIIMQDDRIPDWAKGVGNTL